MSVKDKLHVMVVDDMSTSRVLIVQSLEAMGISNIRDSSSGAEAVASLAKAPVHLVLSDFNMPGMDGLQLLGEIRKNPSTSKVGFILITGKADASVVERGKALGLNNFIKKPFNTSDLKACIEAVVGRL